MPLRIIILAFIIIATPLAAAYSPSLPYLADVGDGRVVGSGVCGLYRGSPKYQSVAAACKSMADGQVIYFVGEKSKDNYQLINRIEFDAIGAGHRDTTASHEPATYKGRPGR